MSRLAAERSVDLPTQAVLSPDDPRNRRFREALVAVGLIVAVVVAALLAADDDPPPVAIAATAQVSSTTTMATGSGSVAPMSSTVASLAMAQQSPATSALANIGAERAFCEVARRYLRRVQSVSVSLSDRTKARELLAGAPAVTELAAAAPAEVRADIVTLSESVTALAVKLDGVGYDLTRLTPDAVMSLQSPGVVTAMGRVYAWVERTC